MRSRSKPKDAKSAELHLKEMEIVRLLEQNSQLQKENDSLRKELALFDTLRQHMAVLTDKLNMLTHLSRELNTFDSDVLAKIVVEKIPLLVNARYLSLFLYNYKNDELTLKCHNHPGEINARIVLKHHQNTLMGLVLQEKKAILVKDIDEFERQRGEKLDRTFAYKYATKSCLCVPLVAGNIICGVLNLADKIDGTFFDELDDLPVIEQLSHLIGVALQNSFLFHEIREQARTDGLTKLANYKTFYEFLRSEIHRTIRYRHKLALIMLDLDDFKQVNDKFGHLVGDALLGHVAQLISSHVRQEDLPARYGGDEFAIVLPETPLAGALTAANRIMERLRRNPFKHKETLLEVHASVGVAEFQEHMTITDFVKKADSAMYAAKAKGKNRIECAASA